MTVYATVNECFIKTKSCFFKQSVARRKRGKQTKSVRVYSFSSLHPYRSFFSFACPFFCEYSTDDHEAF